jgi:tRNA 2-thiouridine synthesizing protein A
VDAPLNAEREVRADEVLDARGLYCPVPILRTRNRLRALAPGATLLVLSDDPVILVDLPAFCQSHGHEYLGHTEGPDRELRLRLRKAESARGR